MSTYFLLIQNLQEYKNAIPKINIPIHLLLNYIYFQNVDIDNFEMKLYKMLGFHMCILYLTHFIYY